MFDARGCPVSCDDRATLELYERALQRQQTFVGNPVEAIDDVLARRPDFVLGHAFRALVLMTWSERRFGRMAEESVRAGERLPANDRERALLGAARLLVEDEWVAACRALDEVLRDHPRDVLALQIAHLFDFYRGDAQSLRDRVARVLPHWSRDLPGYSHVLGMHAFGLEECGAYAEAEETALRALAIEPRDGWTVHAAAHVMEMQRRVDDGVAFLTAREDDWAPASGFAYHCYWHLALFLLARGEHARAFALYDRVFCDLPDMAVHLLDATSLLYRLHLDGHDVRARMRPVAALWQQKLDDEAGFYAFNDVHAAMALAVVGGDLTPLIAAMERRARGTNAEMTREVGLPIARAVRDFAAGDRARARARLDPVLPIAHHFGGSHAQRDVFRKLRDAC